MFRCSMLLVLLVPAVASADRITQMSLAELCVYKAKLSVAGYYYFLQGRPRNEVALQWHGDETTNEKQFVERTIAEVYQAGEAAKHDHPDASDSEQAFGDRVYKTCMSGNGG